MENVFDFQEIINLNLHLHYFLGNLCPKFDSKSKVIEYGIRAVIFVGFFNAGIVMSELMNCYKNLGDLEELTKGLFITLSNLLAVYKFYILIRYQPKILELINDLNRDEFRPKNPNQTKILVEFIKLSKNASKLTLVLCCITCLIFTIYPFTDQDEKNKFPIPAWMPFNTSSSPNFEIAFVYEAVATVIAGITDINMDFFIIALIMALSAQLNILNDTLQNIREDAKLECFDSIKSTPEEQRRNVNRIMERKLFECVRHHHLIINFANECNWLFSYAVFVQMFVSVLINCFTLFQLTLIPIDSFQFFAYLFYELSVLTEVFFFCYSGNEVIIQSYKLTNYAYHCEWIDTSPAFKKNLLFFMTRSHRTMEFSAGGIFILSLDTYVTILKSSWSYCAVLMQLSDQK